MTTADPDRFKVGGALRLHREVTERLGWEPTRTVTVNRRVPRPLLYLAPIVATFPCALFLDPDRTPLSNLLFPGLPGLLFLVVLGVLVTLGQRVLCARAGEIWAVDLDNSGHPTGVGRPVTVTAGRWPGELTVDGVRMWTPSAGRRTQFLAAVAADEHVAE